MLRKQRSFIEEIRGSVFETKNDLEAAWLHNLHEAISFEIGWGAGIKGDYIFVCRTDDYEYILDVIDTHKGYMVTGGTVIEWKIVE